MSGKTTEMETSLSLVLQINFSFLFFLLIEKGHCQIVSIARGGLSVLGETPHVAVTSLSATEACRKAGHSCKRGSDRLYCSCHMVAQPEAPTAYLLEQVSCHGTNNQATWPSSAPGDGENASSESPFFPLPSYRLCPVPCYPTLFFPECWEFHHSPWGVSEY